MPAARSASICSRDGSEARRFNCALSIFLPWSRPPLTVGFSSNSFANSVSTLAAATGSFPTTRPVGPLSGSRSEEHTSELQSQSNLVCRLLLEKKKVDLVTQCCHYDGLFR